MANALALLVGGGPALGANATDGGGGGGGASKNGLMAVVYLACGGLLGFWYDLVHNSFLKLTSSVTMAVMVRAHSPPPLMRARPALELGPPTTRPLAHLPLSCARRLRFGCSRPSTHQGNAKLVVLIGISMAAFEQGTPTWLQGVGVLLGVAGCIYYSIHVHLERQGEREAREADAAMKEAEDGDRVGAAKPHVASENTTLLGQRK